MTPEQDDPTPAERKLYDRIHNLKARRMATRDDAERNALQIAIYELSQQIAALRCQRRQKQENHVHTKQ